MSAITITNTGRNLVRDGEKGSVNPKLLYFAVGTSSTAPTANDTKLGTEVFRKAISSYANGGSVGEILASCYLAPSDAVGVAIAEVGIFGGSSASSTANSGVLLARGLYSHTKTNIESITLQLDLTFS
jgi:hypothetical protein